MMVGKVTEIDFETYKLGIWQSLCPMTISLIYYITIAGKSFQEEN